MILVHFIGVIWCSVQLQFAASPAAAITAASAIEAIWHQRPTRRFFRDYPAGWFLKLWHPYNNWQYLCWTTRRKQIQDDVHFLFWGIHIMIKSTDSVFFQGTDVSVYVFMKCPAFVHICSIQNQEGMKCGKLSWFGGVITDNGEWADVMEVVATCKCKEP